MQCWPLVQGTEIYEQETTEGNKSFYELIYHRRPNIQQRASHQQHIEVTWSWYMKERGVDV